MSTLVSGLITSLESLPTDVTNMIEDYGSHCRPLGKELWRFDYYSSFFDQRFAAADGIVIRTAGSRVFVYFGSQLYCQFETDVYIPCVKIHKNEIYVLKPGELNHLDCSIEVYTLDGTKIHNFKLDISDEKCSNFEFDLQKFIINDDGEIILMTLKTRLSNDGDYNNKKQLKSASLNSPNHPMLVHDKYITFFSRDGNLIREFQLQGNHWDGYFRVLGSTLSGDICIAEERTKIYRYGRFGKLLDVLDISSRCPDINYVECCTPHGDYIFSVLGFWDRLFISNQNCDTLTEIKHKNGHYKIMSICPTPTGRIVVFQSPFVYCLQ